MADIGPNSNGDKRLAKESRADLAQMSGRATAALERLQSQKARSDRALVPRVGWASDLLLDTACDVSDTWHDTGIGTMIIKLRIDANRRGHKRLAVTAAMAALLLGGVSVAPGETSAAVRHTLVVELGLPRAERATILNVVREHRRTATAEWRRILADAIYEESIRAEIDPLLVASIVAKESSFSSRAVSRTGAVGLMQLRPWVARDVAGRADLEWSGIDTLHSPQLNVRLGIHYYKELVERFDGDERKALTAYNFGPTRVSRQLREGSFRGSRYAQEILAMYEELCCDRDNDLPSA